MTQEYAGQKVEWCFCKGTDDKTKSPCNGASREALAKISLAPMREKYAKSGDDDESFYMQANDYNYAAKAGTSASDYNYAAKAGTREDLQYGGSYPTPNL